MTEDDLDGVLQIMVDAINRLIDSDASLSVTLTVGGTLITGEIIPNTLWMREVERLISKAGGAEDGLPIGFGHIFDQVDDMFTKEKELHARVKDRIESWPEEDREAIEESLRETERKSAYIHLRNAQVINGSSNPIPQEGMHWRGRLSDVSGWSIGRLSINR